MSKADDTYATYKELYELSKYEYLTKDQFKRFNVLKKWYKNTTGKEWKYE